MTLISHKTLFYIGNAERDVQAGKAAGMKTLVALFGYLGEADKLEEWGADGLINTPMQVLEYI